MVLIQHLCDAGRGASSLQTKSERVRRRIEPSRWPPGRQLGVVVGFDDATAPADQDPRASIFNVSLAQESLPSTVAPVCLRRRLKENGFCSCRSTAVLASAMQVSAFGVVAG